MKIERRSDDDEPEYLEYLIVGHQGGYGRSLVELWVREYDLKMQLVV